MEVAIMNALSIVLQIVLAIAFLMGGGMKIAGSKMHVESFQHLRLPQWFRVVTGLVEFVGAAAMIIGVWRHSWAAWAGIWLGITMLGAIFAHVRVKDTLKQMAPAIVLFILSVVVLLIRSPELLNFPI
jgi:putative oxidoreductase